MIACTGSDPASIDTDLVNNPNSADESAEQIGMPTMVFEEESFDFGEISQGEKVEHRFAFTNNGDADLIISTATGTRQKCPGSVHRTHGQRISILALP